MPRIRYRRFVTAERDDQIVPRPSLSRPLTTLERERDDRPRSSPQARSLTVREFLETAARLDEARNAGGPKAGLTPAAALVLKKRLAEFRETDFGDPVKREAYRALRKMQENAARGRSTKSQPTGSDKRRFDPSGKDYAVTKYGTLARLYTNNSATFSKGWLPVFLNPAKVIPCIQRSVQREVMFATKKAGKGYHTRKRRTWSSGVPC